MTSECDDSPALLDLLADQLNVLNILGTGKVEFVLNQLRISITRGSHADSDVSSRVKVLRALRGLAADDSCRREILARGQSAYNNKSNYYGVMCTHSNGEPDVF